MRCLVLFSLLLTGSFFPALAGDKPAFDPSDPNVWHEKSAAPAKPDDISEACKYIKTTQCDGAGSLKNSGGIETERQRRAEKRKNKDIERGTYWREAKPSS